MFKEMLLPGHLLGQWDLRDLESQRRMLRKWLLKTAGRKAQDAA